MGKLRVQRVETPSGRTGWTLTTAAGAPVEPAEQFLRHRFDSEASPNTLKGYAHDLKHFFTFLDEQGLDWRKVTPADLGSFTAWLRRPAPNVVPLPGTPPARAFERGETRTGGAGRPAVVWRPIYAAQAA